jgi:hypothetical protein
MPHIFISYRREDTQESALQIYERLIGHFPQEAVFIDKHGISSGQEFETIILQQLAHADVILVIIGPRWATIVDENDPTTPRLKKRKDYVRLEVQQALAKRELGQALVIPVLVEGAKIPGQKELPQPLQSLSKLQASPVSPTTFNSDMEALVKTIQKDAPSATKAAAKPEISAPLASLEKTEPASSSRIEQTQQGSTKSGEDRRRVLEYIGVVIAFLAMVATFLQTPLADSIFPEDDPKEETVATSPAVTDASQATEEVALIEGEPPQAQPIQAEFRVPVDSFNRVMKGLVVAPSVSGMAVWGFNNVDRTLFALSPTLGTRTQIADGLTSFALNEAWAPSALYYDGSWLWVGDSAGQQAIAFDPLTLEEKSRIEVDGAPSAFLHVGDSLWVGLRASGLLTAVRVNHETGETNALCSSPLTVGEAVLDLKVEGERTVWALGRTGEDTVVRSFRLPDCLPSEEISIEGLPYNLAVTSAGVWAAAGDKLYQIQDNQAAMMEEVAAKMLVAYSDGMWVSDTQSSSLSFLSGSDLEETASISLDSPLLDMGLYGAQLWVITEDGFIAPYVVPVHRVNKLVDIAWAKEVLYSVDEASMLCSWADEVPDCQDLSLDGQIPLLMATASNENALWLVTEAKAIFRIALPDGTAEHFYTLGETPASIADELGQRLWLANSASNMLSYLDLGSKREVNLVGGFNPPPPNVLAYDGLALWFAYGGGARQQLVSYRYNATSQVLEQQSQVIPLPQLAKDLLALPDTLYVVSPGEVTIVTDLGAAQPGIQVVGVSAGASALAGTGEVVWVADPGSEGKLYRLDSPE